MLSKRLYPASFSNVNAQLAQKANIAQEAWITPTLQNSWVASTLGSVGYFKDSFGIVHLLGKIKSGTIGSVAFTLPTGYRPASTEEQFIVWGEGTGLIGIKSNGTVNVWSGNSDVGTVLSGITFRAV